MKAWASYWWRGFSIIELLVVVTVIGIIASIVVLNINGAQVNARNVARIKTSQQLYGALQIMVNDIGATGVKALLNGTAPNYTATCLNKDNTDVNGDGKGDCTITGSTAQASEKPELLAELQKITPVPSAKDLTPVTAGGVTYRGPIISTASIDGGAPSLILTYRLERETQDCKLSPVIYFNGSTYSRSQTGMPPYSVSGAGATRCILSLEG